MHKIGFSAFNIALIVRSEIAGPTAGEEGRATGGFSRLETYFGALINIVTRENVFFRLAASFPSSWHYFILSRLIPGFWEHIHARKRLVENAVRAHIARHPTGQTVILSGGFDEVSVRLARAFPAHRFVETEQAATLEIKQAALRQAGIECPANLTFSVYDLTSATLPERLIDPALPVLYVLEGVAMYLRESENNALFKALSAAVQGERYLLFGALSLTLPGKEALGMRFARAVLNASKENYRWRQAPATMERWLARTGWRLEAVSLFGALGTPLLPEDPTVSTGLPDREHYYLCGI